MYTLGINLCWLKYGHTIQESWLILVPSLPPQHFPQNRCAFIGVRINHAQVHQNIYDSYRFERLQLLGITLNNPKRIDNLNAVYTTLSQEELDRYDFRKGDTEGFVNYGLSLDGTKPVILIENKQEGIVKMSFRSKISMSINLPENTLMARHQCTARASCVSLENTELNSNKPCAKIAAPWHENICTSNTTSGNEL